MGGEKIDKMHFRAPYAYTAPTIIRVGASTKDKGQTLNDPGGGSSKIEEKNKLTSRLPRKIIDQPVCHEKKTHRELSARAPQNH